jgi:hypothetical protein
MIVGGLVGVGIVGTAYFTRDFWLPDSIQKCLKERRHRLRESAAFERLKKGQGKMLKKLDHAVKRDSLKNLDLSVRPQRYENHYRILVGAQGTGKSTHIKHLIDNMEEPKGVVYIDVPTNVDSQLSLSKVIENAFNWIPDRRDVDDDKRNRSSSLQISIARG